MITQLKSWAAALGGDVSGRSVLAPGPGHSRQDRSLSVTPSATAPDGFLVHSFAGDDPIACKDHVRAKLGRPEFKPNGHPKPAKKTYFDYPDAHGAVVYQVERTDYHDGRKKTFRQRRPDGNGGWLWNLGGVQPVPYRLPELIEAAGNRNLIVIVEGERKVDLLRSWNIPATCNSGGVQKWRAEHSAYLSGADVVILPDNDQAGRLHVDAVAVSLSEVGASVRVLDLPGLPLKGDVIDWAGAGGTVEQLHALIENEARSWEPTGRESVNAEPAANGEAKPSRPQMTIEWFDEAADSALNDPAAALIEGVLDEGGLSVIYGDSGSGKTFVALDKGFHVGVGLEWNGKKVRRGLVVYVAAEGGKRIKRRIAALQKRYREEYGDVAPDPLFALVRYPIDLRSSDADLNTLIALVREAEKKTGHKCAWLIVDTLSRAMAGGDENSPVDMGRIVAAADRFRAETAAHFTYVHHTGKDAARGARGHSLLRAATDTELETTASSLTLTKQRDGELGFQMGFKLVDLDIGEGADGNCIKSAVVKWSAALAPKTKAKREPAPSQRLLMSVVDQAIDEAAFQFMPRADGPAVWCVKDSIVRDRYFTRIAEPEDDADRGKAHERKRKAWFRSVKAALDAKALLAAPYEGDRVLWKP
jgi:KaiC/GvpD/RAD55 family RecA-like ATPase